MAIKLVAFDWNGTMIADAGPALAAENAALAAVGKPPINLKRFQQAFDIPIIKLWENLGLSERVLKKHLMKIENAFHSHYESLVGHARSRSGVKPALKWLEQNHILAVIYSNHTVPNIEKHLRRWKITHQIDKVLARSIGDHSHIHARIKQQKLQAYVKSRKIKPHEVVSVGDTEEEIEVGKHCGYHTVGLTGGYNTTSRLKKHHPDFLIHNMKELVGIIKKLNK